MSSLLTFVPVFSELNPTPPLFSFSLVSLSLCLQTILHFENKEANLHLSCTQFMICFEFPYHQSTNKYRVYLLFQFLHYPLHIPWKYAFCCFYSFLLKAADASSIRKCPCPYSSSPQPLCSISHHLLKPSSSPLFPSFVWCGNISSLWDFTTLVLVSRIPSVNVQYYLVPLNQRIFSLYKHLYTHPHQIFAIIWFSHEIVRKLNLPPDYLINGIMEVLVGLKSKKKRKRWCSNGG